MTTDNRCSGVRSPLICAYACFFSGLAVAGWVEAAPKKARPAPAETPTTETAAPDPRLAISATGEMSGYYDTDKVSVGSPTIAGNVADPVAGWSVGGRYLLDAVSAASVDIVSSASGRWKELRNVGQGDIKYKPGDVSVDIAGGVSHEPDYLSLSLGGTLTLDLLDKNLVPMVAYTFGHDTAGVSTTPFEIFSRVLIKHTFRVGATIIVDPATSFDIVSDIFIERGNQAKPYRFIPLFAPGAANDLQAGASIAQVNMVRLSLRPGDALPLERNRLALTGRLSHRFSGSAFHVEERLYNDDWGLKASTTDARWVVDVGRSVLFWPHVRAHIQAPVIFWKRVYEASMGPSGAIGVPAIRTGDRELGPLHTMTLGGGLRFRLGQFGGETSWTLTVQGDTVFTKYDDALFITKRTAYFGSVALEAAID